MGRIVFPPCCLTWGQTMVEVMKIMATSFKRSHASTAILSAPDPAADHHQPCLHWRLPPHRQVSVSLLWGHCSFLMGPGAHKILFVPSKSLFPQSCVSSGGSMVGLTATSSKRAYAILRSAAPRAPAPAAGHCWPTPPQEILKHSSGSISVGSLGPGVHKFVWALWVSLVDKGFDSKPLPHDFASPTILLLHFICFISQACLTSPFRTQWCLLGDKGMLNLGCPVLVQPWDRVSQYMLNKGMSKRWRCELRRPLPAFIYLLTEN